MISKFEFCRFRGEVGTGKNGSFDRDSRYCMIDNPGSR